MKEAKKLRHSLANGYSCGEKSRKRIIGAAVELFVEHGFAGALTRDIAARAGVNAPALQYYFDNKEGVYRACVEAMADTVWRHFEPPISRANAVLNERADVPLLINAFLRLQDALADMMFAEPYIPNHQLFFARVQSGQEPKSASEILARRLRKPLNDVSTSLIARISGRAVDDPVTLIRTFSLHGQVMVFHVAHLSTLSLLSRKSFDPEKAAFLKSTIRNQTRYLLEQWNSEREAQAAGDAHRSGMASATGID